MPEPSRRCLDPKSARWGLGLVAALVLGASVIWRCSRGPTAGGSGDPPARVEAAERRSVAPRAPSGISAPIAAAHVAGDVIVAGLDVSSRAIRVQRIDAEDHIVVDRLALSDVAWSSDAELKIVASAEGVALTWRGLRSGKLVRELAMLGPDLGPRGEPTEVAAASCATRDAVWFSDGAHAYARPWTGSPMKLELPRDKDASLFCGQGRAFALLEADDMAAVLPLAGERGAPVTLLREADFGDDEQRELSEYTSGDHVGVVRLAASGSLALRELVGGAPGPLHRLKSTIGREDDVVAVDASSRVVVVVYTQDVSDTLGSALRPSSGSSVGATAVCTKVAALRVDRETLDESVLELSPGRCGHEVGPFFTSALGDGVSVVWTERASGAGPARAPIVGLAHAVVGPSGAPVLARIEQPSDALVDGGCDSDRCYAAALVRRDAAEATAPRSLKILRYK